ncbi:AsmA-like C-terminal region-containing protein, partial [Balneolaceae bacterium ANBcel3]|nr:AsmA-like C-terminal region-containing protein [Balneolaceae bacterium ANBcel3]
ISDASVRSGSHRFSLAGSIRDYLEEHAAFDLTVKGLLALNEIRDYYPVDEELGLEMEGSVDSDVRITGRIDQLENIQLRGTVSTTEVAVQSPDLMLPLRDLNGRIRFTGDSFETDEITFFFGASDYLIAGRVERFMAIMEEAGSVDPARFTGRFHSSFFDSDEFMDFEDVPEEPEPFDAWLPNLEGSIDVDIERLLFFTLEATDISGTIQMTPTSIFSERAVLSMYQGEMEGAFRWDIFAPDHTGVTFNGELRNMRVEELFADFEIGNLSEHVRADFSASTQFYAEFDEYMEMNMAEVKADGDFGMEEARIVDHPVQESLAQLFRSDELKDLSLDHWTATYLIEDGVLTLTDFNLTSRDIGLNLSGTQHLITEALDYRAEVVLPS